jgi:hypothetical protein
MFEQLLASLIAVAADLPVIIRTVEPRAPAQYRLTLRQNCRGHRLEIDGYGLSRPTGGAARIRVNGRPLQGEGVARLQADLSNPAALYRLVGVCVRGERGTDIRINRGERLRGAGVEYRAGRATIVGTRLVSYTGLEPADADSFWFR